MIELRYNADEKLEYRTIVGSEQIYRFGCREPILVKKWDEWKIVPSEQQSSAKKETAAPVDNNLRTERVTLEIVYDPQFWHDPSTWAWSAVLKGRTKTVRVVDETAEAKWLSDAWDSARQAYENWLARVTRERDAAIREVELMRNSALVHSEIADAHASREYAIEDEMSSVIAERDAAQAERDAARAENALLWQAIGLATTAVPSLVIAADDPVGMMRRVVARVAELEAGAKADFVEHERLRDRVHELEAAAAAPPEPRGWLTKNERTAVKSAHNYFAGTERDFIAAALRGLLARESPPRVRRPQRSVDYPHQRDAEWIAAIREAGVEVENE